MLLFFYIYRLFFNEIFKTFVCWTKRKIHGLSNMITRGKKYCLLAVSLTCPLSSFVRGSLVLLRRRVHGIWSHGHVGIFSSQVRTVKKVDYWLVYNTGHIIFHSAFLFKYKKKSQYKKHFATVQQISYTEILLYFAETIQKNTCM